MQLYSQKDLAKLAGMDGPAMSNELSRRPLPPYAILQGTPYKLWRREQAEWYVEYIKIRSAGHWSTPWDGMEPKEYWPKRIMAGQLNLSPVTLEKLLALHPLIPTYSVKHGDHTVDWFDPTEAQNWVNEHARSKRAQQQTADGKTNIYSRTTLAIAIGIDQRRISLMLERYPLPPFGIIPGTDHKAYTQEQVDWYAKAIRDKKVKKDWRTPWDDVPPRVYWNGATLAKKLGLKRSSITPYLQRYTISPAYETQYGRKMLAWYEPSEAQAWVEEVKRREPLRGGRGA